MKTPALLTVVIVAGLTPAAGAQAAVVETSTVTSSVSVPAGVARSLTLSCPQRAVALSGAVRRGFATLTDSFPRSGARRWTFRFGSTGERHRASALLRCVRLDLPVGVRGVTLSVGSAFVGDVDVAPGDSERVRVTCPFGQTPTGWGLRRGDAAVSVAMAVARSGGWVFDLENRGTSSVKTSAYVRCLVPAQRARTGQVHRFSIRTASYTDRFSGTTRHACREGEFSVATGVALAPDEDAFLAAAYPTGERGGRWSFQGTSAAPTVGTSLLCLDQGTSFRRRR